MKSLLIMGLVLIGSEAMAVDTAKFSCWASISKEDNSQSTQIVDSTQEVDASPDWKVLTLAEYNGIKIRIAVSQGKIHTLSIGDGSDDIVKDRGSVRAMRQDFWLENTTQDLQLAVGNVDYFVDCSKE